MLWLQGCPIRCAGCINPDFQAFVPRHILPVRKVLALIRKCSAIEGVTYSGGEPMAQARQLVKLTRELKALGLSVFCYSGYTYDQLLRQGDEDVSELLSLLDILVDGPYEQDKHCDLLWRGSSNQAVRFLSDRYLEWRSVVDQPSADIELIVGDRLTMSGIWGTEFVERLTANLASPKG